MDLHLSNMLNCESVLPYLIVHVRVHAQSGKITCTKHPECTPKFDNSVCIVGALYLLFMLFCFCKLFFLLLSLVFITDMIVLLPQW